MSDEEDWLDAVFERVAKKDLAALPSAEVRLREGMAGSLRHARLTDGELSALAGALVGDLAGDDTEPGA